MSTAFKLIVGSTALVLGMLTGRLVTSGSKPEKQASPQSKCWSIKPSDSTGTARCWSGGKLVYNRAIYHNGGVLCSVDGQQIILNKADLCVVESSQTNVWSPPPPVDR